MQETKPAICVYQYIGIICIWLEVYDKHSNIVQDLQFGMV